MRALKANKTIKIDSIPQGTCAEYAKSGRIFLLEFYFINIFFVLSTHSTNPFYKQIPDLLPKSPAAQVRQSQIWVRD